MLIHFCPKFAAPGQGSNIRTAYGQVRSFYSFERTRVPPGFFDESPISAESFFQRRQSLPFALIMEFTTTPHQVLPRLKYFTAAARNSGTYRVEWVWNIAGLVGLITLDGKSFIVNRRDGQTRVQEDIERVDED